MFPLLFHSDADDPQSKYVDILLRIPSEYFGKNKGVFRYFMEGIVYVWAENDHFLPKYGIRIPLQRV